jgi:2-C-methyl-D-erythritol 4-phosphate cytidylyltransferase / 2-C-methyl-D-erythritol 2,4-cyclodiphosphate synthase
MNNCFIILAAGKSKRFNSKTPKPYHLYKGKALLDHTIDKVKKFKKINKILLVIDKKHRKFIKQINNKKIKIIEGGNTRAESAYKALKFLKRYDIKNVLIHDAARPYFSLKLLDNLFKHLKFNKCVIPIIKTNDSVKYNKENKIINLDRKKIYLTQTPQAFDYKKLLELQLNQSSKITDDASLFINSNKKIKFIKGELNNIKITKKIDIKIKNQIKYGIGFDIHRLVVGRKLYLGGLKIASKLGTLGHSDGDPVLHALIDAILGACGLGDIGVKFSDKKQKFKDIRSTILLSKIIKLIKNKGYTINNIDINIITQTPKIQKYKNKIIYCIAKLCEISKSQINIKGKTTEKLGLIGKEKAIASEVITSVIKND